MKVANQLIVGALVAWVRFVQQRPRAIAVATGLVTLILLGYAATHLRINSDNVRLVAQHLPYRQNYEAFSALFPNLENALLIVVDGETPELARDAAELLTTRLAAKTNAFTQVYLPGAGDFFDHNSLLYRDVDELYDFADQMARVQPLLAELEQDASIANLASLVETGLDAIGDQPDDISHWVAVLDRVSQATVEVYSEYPLAISWEELLLRGSPLDVMHRRVVVAHPILEFESVFSASAPLDVIRSVAAEARLTKERGVTVRITGNPALNYEEMVGIAWDVGGAGVFCFGLVAGILWLALRSARLVITAIAALLTGLIWTAAFAAVSVGYLSLVSVTFAVLFIGLGVDFGIHFGMRYADAIRDGRDNLAAQLESVREVGGSLALCTVTTAIGFFVFVPTDYRGVGELGLIAGVGMWFVFFHTLTLIPALLSSWLPLDSRSEVSGRLRFNPKAIPLLSRHGTAILRCAAVAGTAALFVLPGVRFDQNVINMRNPDTESVQAFNDLLEQSGMASPWFINAVAPDLDHAGVLSAELDELDSVAQTITLQNYIPADQPEKREILTDISYFLPEQ
ncbi:MAG: MMPL family transporter, partial [Myxococcota bacterium]